MNAIIYTTNTGSAERYAVLLAEQTGLPVYSLTEAKKTVSTGTEVIYLGWIMAGLVKALVEKSDRTPEEDDMLDMMRCGGERVKEENLSAVLDWYSARR